MLLTVNWLLMSVSCYIHTVVLTQDYTERLPVQTLKRHSIQPGIQEPLPYFPTPDAVAVASTYLLHAHKQPAPTVLTCSL